MSFPLFSKTVCKNWLLQQLDVSNAYLETRTYHNRLQLNLGLSNIGFVKKKCFDLEGTVRHGIKQSTKPPNAWNLCFQVLEFKTVF